MAKTDSQNTALPLWARISALLLIPIIVVMIEVYPELINKADQKDEPTPMDCPEAFTIVGKAFYKDGTSIIKHVPISLLDITHNQEVTATDGTFSFENVKLDCNREFLQIGLEINDELVTVRPRVDLNGSSTLIDLNQVIFPVKKKDNPRGLADGNHPVQPQPLPDPPSISTTSEVILKYPSGVQQPEVLFEDNGIKVVSLGITSCKLTVSEGLHHVRLKTSTGLWAASFTHQQTVITPGQFKKTQ